MIRRAFVRGMLCLWPLAAVAADKGISERDYLAEIPVVISVARLPQPVDEAPAAVTLIDRETIRLSGMREPVELLRLVPGMLIGYNNGANPVAAYHYPLDAYSLRLQVYVDGRSLYSPYFLGGINWSMVPLAVDDIERIEVVRGANSAAEGANAFFGAVNIVTRDPADTHGVKVSATVGDLGIRDNLLRIGGGNEAADYRLTVARRTDSGIENVYDDKRLSFIDLRTDWRPTVADSVMLRVAATGGGNGWEGRNGSSPTRSQLMASEAAQVEWRRIVSVDEEWRLAFFHVSEHYSDNYIIPLPAPLLGAKYLYDGNARRENVMFQHYFALGNNQRLVWGAEARLDTVYSPGTLGATSSVESSSRLFGNLEWRLTPAWIANLGTTVERSSLAGTAAAPRLALNHHIAPGHTVRVAASKGFRTPSLLEKRADIAFYAVGNGTRVEQLWLARGDVSHEHILAREVAYLGEFNRLNLAWDVRLFEERISGLIGSQNYALPPGYACCDTVAKDMMNVNSARLRGLENQWRWRPLPGSQLLASQAFIRVSNDGDKPPAQAPSHLTTVAWFQQLPAGLNMTLRGQWIGAMNWWASSSYHLNAHRRLDFRLAYPFRTNGQRGEIAFMTENLGNAYGEFQPEFIVRRRSFLTLSLNF